MNSNNNAKTSTCMQMASHKFYLLKPKENADMNDLAMDMINLKDVKEVYVTEGDYGFMLKTSLYNKADSETVEKYISQHVDPKFGTLISYYRLKKHVAKNGNRVKK